MSPAPDVCIGDQNFLLSIVYTYKLLLVWQLCFVIVPHITGGSMQNAPSGKKLKTFYETAATIVKEAHELMVTGKATSSCS